ncbi:Elongation factor 2 [Orbilia ellipsospora]|uniref:Elongation factor 2 n=1 Tax=Orbilia ellipsospora TaxID=2528407 RepID=A0AAV9XIC1_9PEZI
MPQDYDPLSSLRISRTESGITKPIDSLIQAFTKNLSCQNTEPGPTDSPVTSFQVTLDEKDARNVKQERNGNDFFFNLITAQSIDFISPSPYLRMADGVWILTDPTDNVSLQTETLIKQPLDELLKPIFFFDRFTQLLSEGYPEDGIYQVLLRHIKGLNDVIAAHGDANTKLGDVQVRPEKCNVAFGSIQEGWGFNIRHFTGMYSQMFGVDEERMTAHLWGDSFFNPRTKKWMDNSDGMPMKRAFSQFVLDPVLVLYQAAKGGHEGTALHVASKLKIEVKGEDQEKKGMDLFHAIMRNWMPIDACLAAMTAVHLPSPVTAQRYRADSIHEGVSHDEAYNAIAGCDRNGPLSVYIPSLDPTANTVGSDRTYNFGRVFAGTLKAGDGIKIQRRNHVKAEKEDFEWSVVRVESIIAGLGEKGKWGTVEDAAAGGIVCLVRD